MDGKNMLKIINPLEDTNRTKTVQRDKAKKLKPLNIIEKEQGPESKMIMTEKGVLVETDYIIREGLDAMVNNRANNVKSDSDAKLQRDIDKLSQPVMIKKDGKIKSFGESKTITAVSEDDQVRVKLDKLVISDEILNAITPNKQTNGDALSAKSNKSNSSNSDSERKMFSSANIESTNKEENKEKEPKSEIKLSDLKKLGDLGAGSQGHVSKMKDITTGNIIALKQIKLNSDQNFLKSLKIELQTLQSCQSEFIVNCQGVFLDNDMISIALEYMDKGSLANILKKMTRISETILGMITFQVLKGLEYLHKTMKIIHRDIKPSNLLINSKGQVKIADFGVSGKIDSTFEYKQTWVGTLPYMSPERCKGEQYNFDTDIWSLGLTIAECALGRYPFLDQDTDTSKIAFWDILEYISTKPVPDFPSEFSADIKDFVSICLRKEAGTRSTASELLKHKFVKKYSLVGINNFKGWLEYV